MHVVIVIQHKILPRDNNPTITESFQPNIPPTTQQIHVNHEYEKIHTISLWKINLQFFANKNGIFLGRMNKECKSAKSKIDLNGYAVSTVEMGERTAWVRWIIESGQWSMVQRWWHEKFIKRVRPQKGATTMGAVLGPPMKLELQMGKTSHWWTRRHWWKITIRNLKFPGNSISNRSRLKESTPMAQISKMRLPAVWQIFAPHFSVSNGIGLVNKLVKCSWWQCCWSSGCQTAGATMSLW